MTKNCAFTICATNYIGLAKVLENSIKEYYNDVDFYIIVADKPLQSFANLLDENVLIAKDVLGRIYAEDKWNEMSFKYDLTEFCTAIKPASIQYLFEEGYEKCLYFDPDILAFSSIETIFDSLDDYQAIVTPHITKLDLAEYGNIPEQQLLCSGVYNLGFLGLKKTKETEAFLYWWEKKLENKCFASIAENLFTDQKWVDLLPCFLGNSLCVSRNLGMNMAPWNFHERKVRVVEDELFVVCRKGDISENNRLIFVHFSGYNYASLLKKGSLDNRNIKHMESYSDLDVIFDIYRNKLEKGNFAVFADCPYTYNYFLDGTKIPKELRRLYRALIEADGCQENPFLQNSYIYEKAKKMRFVNVGACKSEISSPGVITYDKKRKQRGFSVINFILKLLFIFIGLRRYNTICQLFYLYGIWENHYFLINPKENPYRTRSLY